MDDRARRWRSMSAAPSWPPGWWIRAVVWSPGPGRRPRPAWTPSSYGGRWTRFSPRSWKRSGIPEAELAGVGCGCGGPDGVAGRPGLAAQPAELAGVPAPGPAGRAAAGPAGAGAQRRDLRGRRRALARRGPGPRQHARHGRLDRRRRRADPGRQAGQRGVGQRRPHRPHRGRPEDDGPPCGCGGRGCVEAIARGPALVAVGAGAGLAAGPGATRRPGSWPTTRRTATRWAWPPCSRAGRALGIAIASAASLCDLEVVTVGGGLSQAGPLLFDPLAQALRVHARLDFTRHVQVVPAALGQSAGPGRRRRPHPGRRALLDARLSRLSRG